MSELIPGGLSSAIISTSSSGDTTVIAAQTGRAIKVHRVVLSLATETTVQFKDGSTAMSGPITCLEMVLDYSDDPYFRTTAGNALVLSLGAAVQCGGTIWYRIE